MAHMRWLTLAIPVCTLWTGAPGASAAAQEFECLAPAELDDRDVATFADDLADPSLCLTERWVDENGTRWHLIVVSNVERPGPLWAVPHDEEDEGFAAGVYAVLRYGGTMVAVENGEQRLVIGIDPNQAFMVTQQAADICGRRRQPNPAYVASFLAGWARSWPVVGLHSNWDGYLDGGGLGQISVRRQDPKMIPFPSAVAVGRLADEDTIIMLVSPLPPSENLDGQGTIAWFNDHGIHVIYRHVTPDNNGCTLADYLTLNELGVYFNLEVEHGDAATQLVLIDSLMEFLGVANNP